MWGEKDGGEAHNCKKKKEEVMVLILIGGSWLLVTLSDQLKVGPVQLILQYPYSRRTQMLAIIFIRMRMHGWMDDSIYGDGQGRQSL